MKRRLRKSSCGLYYQINLRFVFHSNLKYFLFKFKVQSPKQWKVVENFSYIPKVRSLLFLYSSISLSFSFYLLRCYPLIKIINHKWVQSLPQWGKNQLMRFFKLVKGHLVVTVGASASGNDGNGNDEKKGKMKILDEDLERSFVEYL